MLDRLILPIGMFLNIAPFAFLCYSPFIDNLRISKKNLIVILSVFFAFQFAINFFFNLTLMSSSIIQIVFYVSFIICFIIYFISIKMSFLKLIFIFLIVANYASFIVGISDFLIPNFFPKYLIKLDSVYTIPGIIIDLALFVITIPLIHFIFNKKMKRLLNLSNTKVWHTLWIIPMMFLLTIVIFSSSNQQKLMISWEYVTVILTLAVVAFVIYYLVPNMIFDTDENATLKEYARMSEWQLALERDHYQMLAGNIEEVRRARHDLRHHILLIQSYIAGNNHEILAKHIEQYQLTLPNESLISLCQNYAVDVIVRYYLEQAKKVAIDVDIKLNLPESIAVADTDLCIVFGNLLENAIEACKKQKDSDQFINISAEFVGKNVVITVDNSFDGNIFKDNNTFLSSKRDGVGIGVTSIQAVAQKYNGVAKSEYDGNIFRASVMLQCS